MLNPDISPSIPNPNHPKLGDTIKIEPIRTVTAIDKIKKALTHSPRYFGIFVVGITWGHMQRTKPDTSIPLLMQAFGHACQQQTLVYLCIQDEEIDLIYPIVEL